jgi:hypothetical protein
MKIDVTLVNSYIVSFSKNVGAFSVKKPRLERIICQNMTMEILVINFVL